MNLDGLTLAVLTRELSDQLVTGQIQRLLQIDKTTIVLKVNTHQGNKDLVITAGNLPACYLSHGITDLPKEPTALCMFLRKHLEGARITAIKQLNGDRILRINADKLALDGSLISNRIYIELMGKYSNCIFVQDGQILEALIHVTPLMNRERSIAPKLTYELPPNSERGSLFEFNNEEIGELLHNFGQGTVAETIRRIFNGFGPALLKEVCYDAGVTEKTEFTSLTAEQITSIATALINLKETINDAKQLYEYENANHKKFYSPVPLTYLLAQGGQLTATYDSISQPLEVSVVKQGGINTTTRELERTLEQAIKKEELRHSKIETELNDSSKADEYKAFGDLLMINAYRDTQYEPNITLDNILVNPVEPITISLVPELTVVENAQNYYKLYTKLKNRKQSGLYQLEQSSRRIDYLQSVLYSLTIADSKETVQEIYNECEQAGLLKKSKKPVSYKAPKHNFMHFQIDGGEIFIGRNNQQNEYLTHRFAKPDDMWFHTLQVQGSHVILRTQGGEPTDEMLTLAARYAAYFSRARESSKVAVDYTPVKFIKKPPASPLGFVIYTNQETAVIDPKEPVLNKETNFYE